MNLLHFNQEYNLNIVIFQGPVNNVDLQSLNDRYLSSSKPQIVTTPLRFRGRVEFLDTLTVDTISLDGLIKVPNR